MNKNTSNIPWTETCLNGKSVSFYVRAHMHIGNMQYIGTQNRGMRETFAETSLIPQRRVNRCMLRVMQKFLKKCCAHYFWYKKDNTFNFMYTNMHILTRAHWWYLLSIAHLAEEVAKL